MAAKLRPPSRSCFAIATVAGGRLSVAGRFVAALGREGVTGEDQKEDAASEVEVEPGIIDLRGRRPTMLVWLGKRRFFYRLAV